MEKMGELLERLVSDLPGLGGWPKWAAECILHRGSCKAMFYDGAGCFQAYPAFPDIRFKEEAEIERIVYRDMYEAALAASKPEWDGEGVPQAGVECEVRTGGSQYDKCRILYAGEEGVAFTYIDPRGQSISIDSVSKHAASDFFRPIRSEADKKKWAAISSLVDFKIGYHSYPKAAEEYMREMTSLYEAIAAGEVAGIRID